MLSAEKIIKLLQLEQLPVEGGYFRQVFKSSETISKDAFTKGRFVSDKIFFTHIYYLTTPENPYSRMHRLVSDEIAYFYYGDPVNHILLYPDGSHEIMTMGKDLEAGQIPVMLLPKNVWQGSYLQPGGKFALTGATMAPGWDDSDFELGDRQLLQAAYPDVADIIYRLTVADPQDLISKFPDTGMTRVQAEE